MPVKRTRGYLSLFLALIAVLAVLVPFHGPARAAANTHVLITEVYYDTNLSNEPEEYVAIYNPTASAVAIAGWQITNGTNTRAFPTGTSISAGQTIYVARTATRFAEQLAFQPTFEYGGNSDATVPDMVNTTATAPTFANAGDEVVLKNGTTTVDAVVYGTGATATAGWSGAAVPVVSGGEIMFRARDEGTLSATSAGLPVFDTDTAADWKWGSRWLTERTYAAGQKFIPYPSYTFTGNITAYSMPDSAYSVLGALVDGAVTSIDLNLYEFHLAQLKDKLVAARGRGVAVRVFLEGGAVGGLTDQGRWVAQELYNAGAQVRFIINDSATNRFQRYAYDHAKYGLFDGTKVFVQSENWKNTGVPVNNTAGNRGWGVVIENSGYAAFMKQQIFDQDWNPAMPDSFPFTPGHATYGGPPAGFVPDTSVPTGTYVSAFASKTFSGTHTVTPVATPEHGLLETKGILGLLKSATKTLYVEQLYIHKYWGSAAQGCNENTCPDVYLQEVINAARRGVKVRVVLDSAFLDTSDPKDNTWTRDYINSIAASEGLDMEARLVNLSQTKVEKVHNKGVIVDGTKTLISSINWSENSPANNREMGVIIENAEIADFYTDIFYYDWYDGTPVKWVTISEVMYDPLGTESDEEWVELHNPTAAAVNVGGWTLKDNAGTWTIPAGTSIAAGSYLTVARNGAAFQARTGVAANLSGLTLSLANTADVVRLVNTAGFEVDRVAWGNYLLNWSISATENKTVSRTVPSRDTNTRLDWTSNAAPTPGR